MAGSVLWSCLTPEIESVLQPWKKSGCHHFFLLTFSYLVFERKSLLAETGRAAKLIEVISKLALPAKVQQDLRQAAMRCWSKGGGYPQNTICIPAVGQLCPALTMKSNKSIVMNSKDKKIGTDALASFEAFEATMSEMRLHVNARARTERFTSEGICY